MDATTSGEAGEGADRRRPYVPPLIESEIIADLSAGGCDQCINPGTDSSAVKNCDGGTLTSS